MTVSCFALPLLCENRVDSGYLSVKTIMDLFAARHLYIMFKTIYKNLTQSSCLDNYSLENTTY